MKDDEAFRGIFLLAAFGEEEGERDGVGATADGEADATGRKDDAVDVHCVPRLSLGKDLTFEVFREAHKKCRGREARAKACEKRAALSWVRGEGERDGARAGVCEFAAAREEFIFDAEGFRKLAHHVHVGLVRNEMVVGCAEGAKEFDDVRRGKSKDFEAVHLDGARGRAREGVGGTRIEGRGRKFAMAR